MQTIIIVVIAEGNSEMANLISRQAEIIQLSHNRELGDYEWEIAESADEIPVYYWVYTGRGTLETSNARFIKLYKPSIARLVSERTGWRIERVR